MRDPHHGDGNDISDELNAMTRKIIGAAIAVHRALGPGLLESAYEACLAYELTKLGFSIERQKPPSSQTPSSVAFVGSV
jgi:hypothetical protein